MPFDLVSPFTPAGDQPRAIRELSTGLARDDRYQTLLGVTGSGKTMTMAHVIARFGRPTLVLSHNKTLAAQLYGELKSFFPRSAVEFFISYYDYYQPEAYVPPTDTYIAKHSSINDDIDRPRRHEHRAAPRRGLPRYPVRDRASHHSARGHRQPGRAHRASRGAPRPQQAARGAAPRVAHRLRHRHAARSRALHGDRELLAPP